MSSDASLEEARRLRAAIDLSVDSIYLTDPETLRFHYVNDMACMRLGYPREALMGMYSYEVVGASREQTQREYCELIATGANQRMKRQYLRSDGSTGWSELHRRAVKVDGRWLVVTIGRDTSERVRAIQQLAESEARFRELTRLSSDWYWEQDEHFRFVTGPARPGDVSQRQVANPRGKTRWEMHGESLTPDVWAAHRAQLESHEEFRDFEYPRLSRDGALRWVSVSGSPMFDAQGRFRGYRGIARDITGAKNAELELREARLQIQLLLDEIPAGIIYTDREHRYQVVNRGYERMRGIRREEVIGRAVRDFVSEEIFQASMSRVLQALAGETLRFERQARHADGRLRDEVVNYVPDRSGEGGVRGVFALITDVTELKDAQRALQRSEAELEERVRSRTADLEAALKELEAFSYSVSHDLRAPLRAIGGFARIVAEGEGDRLSAEGRRRLAVVERNALRMGELVDDLLLLARLSHRVLEPVPLALAPLFESLLAELRPAYPRAEVLIEAMPGAQGDPTLVRQALVNLLDNALKYSCRAKAPRVTAGWDAEAKAYYVRDNGVGFDMAYAGKLFQTFERLHAETDFPGQGIGLAIARRVIERHGGRIWAQSRAGEGAIFFFTLPEAP